MKMEVKLHSTLTHLSLDNLIAQPKVLMYQGSFNAFIDQHLKTLCSQTMKYRNLKLCTYLLEMF
jgi:hypothetical protein